MLPKSQLVILLLAIVVVLLIVVVLYYWYRCRVVFHLTATYTSGTSYAICSGDATGTSHYFHTDMSRSGIFYEKLMSSTSSATPLAIVVMAFSGTGYPVANTSVVYIGFVVTYNATTMALNLSDYKGVIDLTNLFSQLSAIKKYYIHAIGISKLAVVANGTTYSTALPLAVCTNLPNAAGSTTNVIQVLASKSTFGLSLTGGRIVNALIS